MTVSDVNLAVLKFLLYSKHLQSMRPFCRIAKLPPTGISINPRVSSARTYIARQSHASRVNPNNPILRNLFPSARLTVQRSRIDPVTVLIAVTLSIGAGYVVKTITSRTDSKHDGEPTPQEVVDVPIPLLDPSTSGMATAIPPGRPSTLTVEQEVKLREFWHNTLEIFGVSHDHPNGANGSASPAIGSDSLDTSDKKKKSRFSLLGKRHSKDSTPSDAEEDDKHGQTKEFKQALASQSPEQLRDAFWSMVKYDDPDALLLRFLRARKWDVHAATVMLVATMHWRDQEMHVDDDIMYRGEGGAVKDIKSGNAGQKREGEDLISQMRMGKSFLHGTDAEGRPICCVRARLHKPGEQTERSLERYTVYTIESCRMLLRSPIDTAVS